MICPKLFLTELIKNNVLFFTGVPDSLLEPFCSCVEDQLSESQHIIGANEGSCASLAAGYYLSTRKIPLVYMQNSGLGNIVNPLTSLMDQEVYSIPMLLLIGLRGVPNHKDEPQHKKMGRITSSLLDCLEIPYRVLSSDSNWASTLKEAFFCINQKQTSYALLIKPETFYPYSKSSLKTHISSLELSRQYALEFCLKKIKRRSLIISTTGHLSRELYQYRLKEKEKEKNHSKDFKVVGAMGHANQIALGIANHVNKKVYCLDGDGASLMHLGNLAICAQKGKKNFKHILFNNGAHGSVGGQKTVGHEINFVSLSKAFGYKSFQKVKTKKELETAWVNFEKEPGPSFLEILINTNVEKNLPRPKEMPLKSKASFMDFINEC